MKLKELCAQPRAKVLKRLRDEWALVRLFRSIECPTEGQISVSGDDVTIWPKEKEESRVLALAIGKHFGVNGWKREFSSWTGKWKYATRDVDLVGLVLRSNAYQKITIDVMGAPMPKNCRIIEKKVMATRYESVCGPEEEKV